MLANENPEAVFKTRENNFRALKDKYRRIFNTTTVVRLASFSVAIILFFLLFKLNPYFAFGGFLIFFIIFLIYIKKSAAAKRNLKKYGFLEAINTDEIKRLHYNIKSFDRGEEFIDSNHHYTFDLDIFGNYSLFQYLNRTVSYFGKRTLAEWLQNPAGLEAIAQRQEAVKELAGNLDFGQHYRAEGMLVNDKEEDYTRIEQWFEAENYFSKKKYLSFILILLPAITVLLWLSTIFGITYFPAVIFSLIQLAFAGVYLKHINREHAATSRSLGMIRQLEGLLKIISETKFSSTLLTNLQAGLSVKKNGASQKIKQLGNLINLFDNRLNMLAALFLNGLFMWDIRMCLTLEKWKIQNKDNWGLWLQNLSQFDALISIGSYYFSNPAYQFPDFTNKPDLVTTALGHPLIPPGERVCNDFSIKEGIKVALVTGSNMSGKSTFLRSLGVNMVLAFAGAPVCAKNFSTPLYRIFSSMRISDDLDRHESTFYAELKRLRLMLDLQKETNLYVLLDEILKGTNSADKFTGSKALLEQLFEFNSLSVVATHDLALGELEKSHPQKLRNYSFEVEIEHDKFHFDYKLKNGICKIMNASELMKQMGIKL